MKTMTTWQDYAGKTGAATTTWNYDPNTGQLTNKRYHDNLGPDYTYTPAGRLHQRFWARANETGRIETAYTYNTAGDLASVAYSDNTPGATYTHNRLGRRTSASSAPSAVAYSYTDAGQLLTETHTAGPLAGLAVTNNYDALLRRSSLGVLTSDLRPLTSPVAFSYDSASRLATVGQASLLAQYAYEPNAPGLVNTITFRTAGAPMMTTTKTYDNLNRLTSINHVIPSLSRNLQYSYQLNAANQRTKRTDADGSYWDYGYDSLGQVTNAVRHWADGTLVTGQQYGYQFDDIGNRKTSGIGFQPVQSEYTANLLNQYTQRTVPGSVNLLGSAATNATVTVNGATATRQGEYFHSELALANTNNAAYSPIAITANMTSGTNNLAVTNTGHAFLPKTPEQFTHDADGNLISDGRWQYTWDAENRLIAIETLPNLPTNVPVQKLMFQYDAQSRRISKVVSNFNGSTWTEISNLRFICDGWQCLAELDALATPPLPLRTYAWGLDLSGSPTGAGGIAGLLFGTFNGSSSTSSVAYAFDGNGNVTSLLDMRTGQLAAEYEYSPFGETIRATGPLAKENPFRFSTKRTDDTTGLIFYEHRILRPDIGRWLSRDPIGERGGVGLYNFLHNDALRSIDPYGLFLFLTGCSSPRTCVCEGKTVDATPVDSGVKRFYWKDVNPDPDGYVPYHVWLTWPNQRNGSVDNNAIIGSYRVSSPALGPDKYKVPAPTSETKMLSPCKFDFARLHQCLERKSAGLHGKLVQKVCDKFADDLYVDCLKESAGCTVK